MQSCIAFSLIHCNFSLASALTLQMICQTGRAHSLKINEDETNSWRSTCDNKVGQFILIFNNLNVKVERVN